MGGLRGRRNGLRVVRHRGEGGMLGARTDEMCPSPPGHETCPGVLLLSVRGKMRCAANTRTGKANDEGESDRASSASMTEVSITPAYARNGTRSETRDGAK